MLIINDENLATELRKELSMTEGVDWKYSKPVKAEVSIEVPKKTPKKAPAKKTKKNAKK